jgi:PDZ domain
MVRLALCCRHRDVTVLETDVSNFSTIFPGGCFVTKVSPDGSAARSGGVEVGDQLACINGASSLHMKVDDICDVIANSSDPTQVELVFLRYIGPFRAANKTLLETKDNFRLGSNGSFDDSLAKEKKSKSLWRMNPIKSSKKEPAKPVKVGQGDKTAAKKKGGFRLFGRGKKSNNNE